jgi:hypothetical protein
MSPVNRMSRSRLLRCLFLYRFLAQSASGQKEILDIIHSNTS